MALAATSEDGPEGGVDADRITKRQGTDRYADSAGCPQQGQLLRSGQRFLETAALAGGWWCSRWRGSAWPLDAWPSWMEVDRGRWKIADEQIFSPLAGI